MIGIIVAMQRELEAFLASIPTEQQIYRGKTFYTCEYKGAGIVFALCGIGKVNAAYSAALMIEHFEPEFILSTGTSGGFGVDIMDVVIADRVVQHDVDTSVFGDPVGFVSGVNKVYFDADSKLSELCAKAYPNAKTGCVASGDQFIADHKVAAQIVGRFGAIACDMEAGAIGQVAYMAGVKFAVVRTITDNGSDGAAISFEEMLTKASAVNCKAVLKVLEAVGTI